MHFNKPYRTFPLRTTLVVSVILTAFMIVLICFGLVGYPAYSKARREIHVLWEDIANQVALNAKEQIVSYFQNAPATLKMVAGLVEEGQLNLSSNEAIFDISYRMLKENPEFVTAYYFKPDGTFYGVLRDPQGFQATYRVVNGAATEVKNFQIRPGNEWVEFEQKRDTYDPRKRPFWPQALAHPEGGWSEVYEFADGRGKGFTYVLAQKGRENIEGYWAVDFEISELTQFLHSLKAGKEGSIYILTQNGIKVAESSDIDAPALQIYLQSRSQSGRRIFSTQLLPEDLGISWKIITTIHENDFLKPIRNEALRSLQIGLFLTLIFLIGTALFFGKVSKRLKEIAWEMDEIGNLIFKDRGRGPLVSRIREVNAMNHALAKMKVGLQSFAKYIPVDVVKKLIFSGDAAKPGAEKKTVTVMFADLAHFTSMAEELSSGETVQILEQFLTGATDAVDQEKGIVDKFIGDAVMAIWGAPQTIENPAIAACRAAIKMRDQLGSNGRLDHRIGINTGSAMVGNFGSAKRLDYTAIGDAVNIASRLEKLNKVYGTKILLGQATADEVKETFLIRPVDSVLLEGKGHPLIVYELFGNPNQFPEPIHKAIAIYRSALDAYQGGRFAEAAPLFEEANKLFGGNDPPSQKLLELTLKHLR